MLLMTCLLLALMGSSVSAHSGRTDANGGHNCSAKSKQKGLCTGYHYHNTGSKSTTKTSKSSFSSKSTTKSNDKIKPKSSFSKSVNQVDTKDQYKQSDVKLYVNAELVKLTNKPIQKNNSNYFPVRLVANAVGAKISFDAKQETITITKDSKSVVLASNKEDVIVKDNVTYAPIRSIVSALQIYVNYDSHNNSVFLTYQ